MDFDATIMQELVGLEQDDNVLVSCETGWDCRCHLGCCSGVEILSHWVVLGVLYGDMHWSCCHVGCFVNVQCGVFAVARAVLGGVLDGDGPLSRITALGLRKLL